jgi:hypothetical protein
MSIALQNKNYSTQDAFGRRVAARLDSGAQHLPHEIAERLKAARMVALSARKVPQMQVAGGIVSNGGTAALLLGDGHRSLWEQFAALLPLVVLLVGLLTIGILQEQNRAQELAEVDAELLVDELPPAAYTDPGFTHFLSLKQQD